MSKSGSLPRFADEFEDDDDIELVEGADFGKK